MNVFRSQQSTGVEESLALNEVIEAQMAVEQGIETLPPDRTRASRRAGEGIFPPPVFLDEAEDLTCQGPDGPVRLRIVRADEPKGVYLHIHGGGWVLGAADLQDVMLRQIARNTGLTVVSVDYRLAPEHPYPAGPDDCETAADWLVVNGCDLLGAPARIVVGGESAGAHLSLVTLLRMRDRHDALDQFIGANLVYGVYDLARTPSSRRWDRLLILTPNTLDWFGACFLGGRTEEMARDPDISPLFAELTGLPPCLLTVGTADPLIDDSMFLSARLETAGVGHELVIYEEACHGFDMFPTTTARVAEEHMYSVIRGWVDQDR